MDSEQSGEKNSFRRLAAINRAITTSLNFEEVLRLIVVNAAELFAAETSLLLLGDGSGMLQVKSVHGVGREKLRDFSGHMEEAVVRDLVGILELTPHQQLATAPVITDGALKGFLAVVRRGPLNKEESWQLSALADQAAIALNNAHFHEVVTATAWRERDESLVALRASELRSSQILSSITELFFQLDRESRIVDVNHLFEEVFRKPREELLGRVFWEVFPKSRETPLAENFRKATTSGMAVHFEVASKTVLGIWFEAHVYPIEDGLTIYLRDITDRKQAEINNNLLAAIVESSEDAIISKDLNGIIKTWNHGAERIFGYTAENVIGKSVTILMPPELHHEEPSIIAQIKQGKRVDHYESVRRRKDGTLIDISLTTSPIRDDAGVIIGASKIAREITERKLREEEIRFQAHLLAAVEQAVIATDIEGIVTYWNSFAERLYGWTAAEAVGRNILDLTPPAHALDQAVDVMEQLRKGQGWSGEFSVRRKDGSVFPASVSDWPILDPNGNLVGIVGVSVDITERRLAEEERSRLLKAEREARAESERANALKDEFLATLSHELRNPLNVILGYSEILLRNELVEESEFLKNALGIVKRNAMAQSQLVRDLLDLSRLHMGKLSLTREVMSFQSVIENAVETVVADALLKNINIIVETGDDVCLVLADQLRLEQIVWNLLNNAIKFTEPGGNVTVNLTRQDGEAVLKVIDSGQGIEPNFLPSVFEMFRQADASSSRKHGGLGIGLALVRQLVDLHEGTVVAASDGPGKGSEFAVRIPLMQPPLPEEKMAGDAEDRGLKQLRVLIVDDSPDTVEMLQILLEFEGALVDSAMSGEDALKLASAREFDVIVSDISMPHMDGFEFLRRLRSIPKHAHVPVLALTGFGRPEDISRAHAEGFFRHVIKPIDVDDLLGLLRQIPRQNYNAALL